MTNTTPLFTVSTPFIPLVPGTINLRNRPHVRNPDGTVSSVRSVTFLVDGLAVLVPTVVGDRVVSNNEALAHYRKTGQHLGKFLSEHAANAYAKALHEQQARYGKHR